MQPKSRDDFGIAIICALPFEAEAVEALFDEHYDRLGQYYGKQPGDANAYINGRIGKHDVVVCYMSDMGKGSAASVASSLIISYTGIKLALVVGICGGVPSPPEYGEIFLGDVIISDSVVEYDFGRQYPGGFKRRAGAKDTLGQQSREVRAILNVLRGQNARSELGDRTQQYLHTVQQRGIKWCHPGVNDILLDASYVHKHSHSTSPAECSCFQSTSLDQICEEALGKSCDELGCDQSQQIRCRESSEATMISIQIGPVASADMVMKSGQHRDEIARSEKVLGFEMEGAGVWDKISCIIIKGVCDYADSHKNKLWQKYAAATGASVAKAFLEYWVPADRKDASGNCHLMIPFVRNPHFAGRQKELQKMEDLIFMQNGPRKLAITGLGGVGKTQIALELAYRIRDRERDCSIFWIPCTSYEAVEQAFMTIARMVGLQGVQPAEVKERLKGYFSQINTKWILIFDNADEMDMWMKGNATAPPLKNMVPQSNTGHVLFTSRNRKLAVNLAASNVLSVPDVDERTAKEIFSNLLIQKALLQDEGLANTLLEQLAFLPLAISQAAAYINQNDISLETYMSLLGEQEADTIEMLSEEFEDEGRYAEIQNPVATTWLISFLQIQEANDVASDYLSFMACISPRHIPESILPPTTSAKRRVEALGLLKAYSFVSAQRDGSVFSLHRLVHLATRNWLRRRGTFDSWIERATKQLDEIFPDSEHHDRQTWREYLPHALYLAGSAEFQARQGNYVNFLARIASCLKGDGRYAEAEILFRKVLEIRERDWGPNQPNTLVIANLLSLVLEDQGKYKEAEAILRSNLIILKQVLGPEYSDTLFTICQLGTLLEQQSRYKEAETIYRQALKDYEKILGSEHPNILAIISSLGEVLSRQGRYKEAEAMQQQALEDYEKVLGPEHPHTLKAIYRLGILLEKQSRNKEAETIYRQALKDTEKILGSEHPNILAIISSLGEVLSRQGRYKDAEAIQQRALEDSKKVLGPEHPDTLFVMSYLSFILAWQDKYKEAEIIQQQTFAGFKKIFGLEHPRTLISMRNLAYYLKKLGKVPDALVLLKECAELRNRVLGSDHPATISSFRLLRDWESEARF